MANKKTGAPDTILHQLVRESPSLAQSTIGTYLSDLNAWIEFAGEDPKGWTRYKAQKFYTHLRERMRTQSANRIMATLAFAAGWWAKMEGKPELDFSVIQKARPDDIEEREAMTDEQAQQLLEVITRKKKAEPQRARRDIALVVTGLETGMRRMSLSSMRFDQMGPIVVDGKNVLVANVQLKGSPKLYAVAVSETAEAALAPWLAFLNESKIDKGPVWRSLRQPGRRLLIGNALTGQAIYDLVVRYGEEAKIEGLTPHIFRHSFISWRLAAGWTPQQVASITGHQLPRALGLASGDIGTMHDYVTPSVFWPKVSTGTPAWLQAFVKEQCR